ncbi:MAG: glycoside hydrolase family 2 TIM barrel-domain containing protein, partial [Clostridiales bacterium]|nr:glycoside hydrolase family 2 TIM barrel-domain containing protein [Clostridiales bacterium]
MNAIREVDLKGTWSFTPEGGKRVEIQVPGGGWLKQGFNCEAGTYERYITIPEIDSSCVVNLELGAVNHYAEYYIGKDENSLKKIYEEVTAFTPQAVDLTNHVQQGKTYLLKIFVRAFKDGQPVAPHCAQWCECIARGIFRDAYLRIYPEIYISDTFIKTYVSENKLKCDVWISDSTDSDRTITISGEFFSWNGDKWNYPDIPGTEFTVKAGQTGKLTLGDVEWTPGPESYWWPNVPYSEEYRTKLHILRLILKEGNRIIHTKDTRFGFREIKQAGKYYELNGVRVNFRGDNLQVANYDRIDHDGRGDAIDTLPGFLPPSDGNPGWPKAVDNFLRLNYNVQREHMEPWTPYMIDICDEMGLMLIGESACRGNGFDMEDGRGFHELKCLKDMVKRDKNHPSIIRWSTKNESNCLDQSYHIELYEAVKSIDDTRPVSEDIFAGYLGSFDNYDNVFGTLKNKNDFTWIEHYLSYDEEGKVINTCKFHNDAVIPLPDRPFGTGEANCLWCSTALGLVWFATTIVLARAQGASDARPYVLLSSWASSIPGVKTIDFLTEENRPPVYGEDNLPYPWEHHGIKLLQKA